MRSVLITLSLILVVFGIYYAMGNKEAAYRHDSPQLRSKACLEHSTIDVAVAVTDENEEDFRNGVSMAVVEANNRRNPDGSVGVLVKNASDSLVAKKIRCRYYKYDSNEKSLAYAREISRNYNYTAVLGHNTSDEAYPASLIYNETGLLYICPFATSTRISSHNWPTLIRVTPSVKGFMSAILENISFLFGERRDTIRLAVYSTNSIYSEDAVTILQRYIADSKRLIDILDKAETLITENQFSPDRPIYEWLKIDTDVQKNMLDTFDASDKLFVIQKLSHFGFTNPGVRSEDLDIERLQRTDNKLLFKDITVAAAIDTLRKLTPNIEVVYSARYRQNTREFTNYTHMLSISNTDIILLLDYINDTSVELIKEIRESGNKQPIIGDDGIEYPVEIKQLLGGLAGDIYAVSVYDDQNHGSILMRKYQELSKYFPEKRRDVKPDYNAYQAYRSASLFVEAVTKCQSSDPYIIATRIKYGAENGWIASSGTPLFFDSNGEIIDPEFLLKKYDDGRFYNYNVKEH